MKKFLNEGERAIGAHYFNAPAKLYHGVDNPDGALEGAGPVLENDSRLIEAHVRRLADGRPIETVVQDLLETGKRTSMTPHEKMLVKLAMNSSMGIYKR